MHYSRARRHNGDPLAGRSRTPRGETLAYYWAHVDDDTDDCLIWPYSKSYGAVRLDGCTQYVHVLACTRHHGPKPPGMLVLHAPVICHNPTCFNWRHLAWGTPKGNADDRTLDGTSVAGDRNAAAILTWDQVREIRSRWAAGGIRQRDLAAEYGVTQPNIGYVVRGETWKQ